MTDTPKDGILRRLRHTRLMGLSAVATLTMFVIFAACMTHGVAVFVAVARDASGANVVARTALLTFSGSVGFGGVLWALCRIRTGGDAFDYSATSVTVRRDATDLRRCGPASGRGGGRLPPRRQSQRSAPLCLVVLWQGFVSSLHSVGTGAFLCGQYRQADGVLLSGFSNHDVMLWGTLCPVCGLVLVTAWLIWASEPILDAAMLTVIGLLGLLFLVPSFIVGVQQARRRADGITNTE